VQTHPMTIYTEAKINRKMARNWPWNRSPGEFDTALRSIFWRTKGVCVENPEGKGPCVEILGGKGRRVGI
jgi:hypothetical protein